MYIWKQIITEWSIPLNIRKEVFYNLNVKIMKINNIVNLFNFFYNPAEQNSEY